MTVAEFGSLLMEDTRIEEPARPEAVTILDTTELRWFVPGPLPVDIGAWFTGATGVREERCDTYLVDGRSDVGVKRRFRATLELKVRQSLDRQIEFGQGLAGTPEVWRRWSPANDLVDVSFGGRWLDVCKAIVKRRFAADGTEIAFSSGPPTVGAGCDVEVAQVMVGAVHAWTLAFAAFGPLASRRDALHASWQGLMAAGQCPELFGPRTARAMGYPEWLGVAGFPDLRLRGTGEQRPVALSH